MTTPSTTFKWTRASLWLLCIAAALIWLFGTIVSIWLPYASKGANTGALDEIIYTASVIVAVACWLVACGLALWQRKQLGGSRWLPLWVLVTLAVLKGLTYFGGDYQEAQHSSEALLGNRIRGYLDSDNRTEDKAILVYFMDFPGEPPNDDELRKPVSVVEHTGRRTGGGGETSLSPSANYSLNESKRLRWYIWHITQRGDEVKNTDGSTSFVPNILLTDPKIAVVVCEATVPVYVSPLTEGIYSDPKRDWRLSTANDLVTTFFDDGRSFTLTAPAGITGNDDWNEDIKKHLHKGDCK
jgi:hypothetical protein